MDLTKRAINVHANYKSTRMGDRERKIKRSPNPERLEINEKNHNVLCILIYIAVIFPLDYCYLMFTKQLLIIFPCTMFIRSKTYE